MCINQHAKYLRKSNKSALGGLANSKGISVKLGMGRSSDHLTNITWLVTSNCLGNACSFHPCIFLDVRSVWYVWWSVKAVFKPGSSPDYQYWSLVLLTTVVWGSIPPYRGADSIMFASYLLLALHSKQHDWLSHYFLFHGFMMAGREVCSAEETECLIDIYNQTFIGLGQCNLLTSVVQVHALRASWKKARLMLPCMAKNIIKGEQLCVLWYSHMMTCHAFRKDCSSLPECWVPTENNKQQTFKPSAKTFSKRFKWCTELHNRSMIWK